MTEPEILSERLRLAADDGGRPVSTDLDGLLGRARRTKQRRRAVRATAAAVVSVAAVTTAALVLPSLGDDSSSDRPVAPGGSGTTAADPVPTTPPAPDPVLTDREVVRRCQPQLEKYYALPQYARGDWQVAHDRAYRVGDVVLLHEPGTTDTGAGFLVPTGPNPVLCQVPAEGDEQAAVPVEAFTPDPADPARLSELCSESWLPDPSPYATPWTDLRGGQVVAVDSAGPATTALLRVDAGLFACVLSPVTWDSGISGVMTAGAGSLFLNGSTTGIKSRGGLAAYYYGAGLTKKRADRLRITLADGRTFERPVGAGGAYAVMLRVPGSEGLLDVTIDALDAEGRVLDSGS